MNGQDLVDLVQKCQSRAPIHTYERGGTLTEERALLQEQAHFHADVVHGGVGDTLHSRTLLKQLVDFGKVCIAHDDEACIDAHCRSTETAVVQ